MLNEYIHSNFDASSKEKGNNKGSKKQKGGQKKDSQQTSSAVYANKESKKKETGITHRKVEKDSKVEHAHPHEHHLTDTIKEKFQEFIGHFNHAPPTFGANPFIHTGYRINFSTPKKVLKSLFMIHNESVNVWTHLGGAIILIIMCVALTFSVNSIDTQNIRKFVQTEVSDLFKPIYSHLPDFSTLEHDFSEKLHHAKEDIEHMLVNLEHKLQTITEEIEHVKQDINPENVGRLLNKMKGQLKGLPESLVHLKDSKGKFEKLTKSLETKINELQGELLQKIDSTDFDWIDIYKYINPSYSSSIVLKEGYHNMPLSRWPIIVFLLSAVFCLMCSAIYHLFFCLSEKSTSILITGSAFPAFVYGFYCQPIYSKIYLTIIGITSLIVFFVSLGDTIHQEPYRKLKSIMYGSLGTFAGLPIIHLLYLSMTATEPHDNLNFMTSLPYYLIMGVSYLSGLTIYATKVPERYCPGKFDIWGHSHQIWHVAVLSGIIFTYFGAFDNYYTRMKLPCIGCGLE